MIVRLFAGAADAAGWRTSEVDASKLDVTTFLGQLEDDNPGLKHVLPTCILLADGVRIDDRTQILDGVIQLDVLPPFSGG